MKFGVNKRVCCLMPQFEKNEIEFNLNDHTELTSINLFIGVNLNLETAFNVLELGPTPHDPKVKEFLSFWGENASLRR